MKELPFLESSVVSINSSTKIISKIINSSNKIISKKIRVHFFVVKILFLGIFYMTGVYQYKVSLLFVCFPAVTTHCGCISTAR